MSRRTECGISTSQKRSGRAVASGPRMRSFARRAGAAVVLAATMLLAGVAFAPAASAVESIGPGVRGTYGHIGATLQPGVGNVYCVDSSLQIPFGRGVVEDSIVSSLPARPGVSKAIDADRNAVRGLNFIASTWGGTGDDVTAAAVGIATMAFVKSGGFDTAASYMNRGDVIERARGMYTQAQAVIAAAPPAGTASGKVVLTVDPENNYLGSLRVTATVPASGTLRLTNGVFADNDTDTLADARTGVDYPIRGVPPTADGKPYRISAASVGEFSGGQIWPDRVRVIDFGVGYQRMIVGVGPVAQTFPVQGQDQQDRTTTFQPILTSRTSPVSPEGELSDALTFATNANENHGNNPWPRRSDGAYHEVSFTVTAYATGGTLPAEQPAIPHDAEPVGTARVMAVGPGTSQTVKIPGTHPQGRYTFVASYDGAGTPPETRRYLPAGYAWSHAYGMESETTSVPMTIGLSSKILTDTIGPGGRGDDSVTLSTEGPWLTDTDGQPIEVVALGSYVYLPASLGAVEPTDDLPEGAEIRGTVKATFTGPGSQDTTSLEVLSGEISAPDVSDGAMSWRWSVPTEAQSSPALVIPTMEKVGLPEQTQRIQLPTVTTKAQTDVPWGGTATDTALVSGPLPATGAITVRWEAFRGPEGTTDLTQVCTAQNRIPLDGTAQAVTSSPSELVSPAVQDVRFPVVWQEIATWIPSSGTPVDYHRGECGVAHEISTPLPQPAALPAPATPPRLAATGGASSAGPVVLAGTLGLAGALTLLLGMRRRRRR